MWMDVIFLVLALAPLMATSRPVLQRLERLSARQDDARSIR